MEKSFSYVIRVPSSDGFELMNVDVKIDTSWLFRDVEEGSEEQGCHLEEAASSPDGDTGSLWRQLESSEQKPSAAVDKHVTSESRMKSRIQELELSEQSLLQKVEQLNTQIFQERTASLRAQEQLEALQEELASRDELSRVQDEFLPLPRKEVPAPCRSQGQQASIGPSEVRGASISAGQPSEAPSTQTCTPDGQGPSVWAPGLETTGELLGALAGPEWDQLTPAEPSLDEQILLLCGCSSGQGLDGTVHPVDLACLSERGPAAAPAQESFALMQMSTFHLQGLAWGPAALPLHTLWEASPEEPQIQELLDASQATGQPCWDCRRMMSCPPSVHPKLPGKGPRGWEETLMEESGVPGWRVEEQRKRRTSGRKEDGLGARCGLSQESPEDLSLEDGARAPEGKQNEDGASETPAAAFRPWPSRELPMPLLQGETSVATAVPEALSRGRRGGPGIWDPQGAHSSEQEEEVLPAAFPRGREATGPPPAGRQVSAEQDRALRGGVQAQEAMQHLGLEKAVLLLEENPVVQGQEGEEEKILHQEGSRSVLEESAVKGCKDKEMWFSVEEGGSPPRPGLASAEAGDPARTLWAPSKGNGRYAVKIEEFEKEMEACFQHVSILQPGNVERRWKTSLLVGENWSFARKWHSHENAYSKEGFTNLDLDSHSAEQAEPRKTDEIVRPGKAEALGPRGDLPGMEPHLDGMSYPARPSELVLGQLPQPLGALGRVKRRFGQLISELKEERSKVLLDNAKLRGDHERCHKKIRVLERERERNKERLSTLEQEHARLVGDVTHLKTEVDQYLQVISDLEDCNRKSYHKILELEEENEKLKGNLGRMQKAMSENFGNSKGVTEHVTLENRKLKALVSELGLSYKELIKDIVLGLEDMIQGLSGENGRLLRRIRVLESKVALELSADAVRLVRGERHLQGEAKSALDKATSIGKAVQVLPLSGQLITRAPGLSLQEELALGGGQMGPSLCMESSRHSTDPMASPLTWRNADASNALQENVHGAGVNKVPLGREERGQALWSPSWDPQVGWH
ncbi:uncharacterized protein C4orf50 homolog [Tamandua tetradactyla]|uniref:uncharacterized protein C4orf50 homolog n=1 Tax=Tamandua tetradactyla TaxID=48850 RepID=UPI00405437FE